MPVPPVDGGCQVMHYTTLGLLQAGVSVKTVAINPSRQYVKDEDIPDDHRAAVRLEYVKVDTAVKPWALLLNLFSRTSYFVTRFHSPEFELKLSEVLLAEKFDIIQLEHIYLCIFLPVIRKYSSAKVILRPQNIEHRIWKKYLEGLTNPFKIFFLKIATNRLERFEQEAAKKVDGVIALTNTDAEFFERHNDNVTVVSMGYDYSRLNGNNVSEQFKKPLQFYHLASMDWLPNLEATEWFLKKVIPLIKASGKKLPVHLAGKNMPEFVFRYRSEGIHVEGRIDDPNEYLKDKQIMIVPLWSGSGIRAKIIEGLAMGKTIISTGIGAEGIDYTDGIDLIIADTPEKFASAMLNLYEDPERCRMIGIAAKKLSEEKYHYLVTAKKMAGFYSDLN